MSEDGFRSDVRFKVNDSLIGYSLNILDKTLMFLITIIEAGNTDIFYNYRILCFVQGILKTMVWRPEFDSQQITNTKKPKTNKPEHKINKTKEINSNQSIIVKD
jgi:hypothetical protein